MRPATHSLTTKILLLLMPKFYVFPTLLLLSLMTAAQTLHAQCAASALPTPISCFGAANGSIQLSVANGAAPYTWLGSVNGVPQPPFTETNNSLVLSNLLPGAYQFTVTDNAGCTAVANALLTQPTALSLSTAITPALCFGGSTGFIDLTATGGTGTRAYLWSNGSTTQDLSNLSAGTYCVTVTDANGCTASTCATVPQSQPILTSTGVSNVACFGGSTGAINLNASGGTGTFTFNWSHLPGNNDPEDLSSLSAGTYTVTITDANGCTRTNSTTVTQPTAIALSTSPIPVKCHGGSDGAIDLSVSGGTGTYTYRWNDAHTTQDRSKLSAGTYTVTVTDASKCTATASVVVGEPAQVLIAPTVTDVACGGNIGAITFGTLPGYTFVWSNGSPTLDLSNLPVGTYTVTLTSPIGCTTTVSTTLGMALSLVKTDPAATCSPGATGSLDLTVTKGSGGYTFQWSNNAATEDQSNLAPGTYTVTVTESAGCTATASATIVQPAALEIAAFPLPNPCAGVFSGKIKLDVTSGHSAPYSVTWASGAFSKTQNDLPGEPFTLNAPTLGDYTITVTNALGCTATATATLAAGDLIELSVAVTDVSCFGNNDGSIDLTVTGGPSVCSYAWSNGSTTQDLNNLSPGTYTVTVTDCNIGCTATASATVGEPTRLVATAAATPVACFGGTDGSISLSVTGGTQPYEYNWTHTVNTQNAQNLAPGTYTVTVTDASGCTTTASATVTQPAAAQILMLDSASPPSSCAAADGTLTLSAPAGSQPPYLFAWSNGTASGTGSGLVLSGLIAGPYTVTLTDGQGCTSSAALAQNSQMAAIPASSPTSTCTAEDGAIQISMLGNFVAPFTYIWRRGALNGSGSATNPDFDINDLRQGDYTVEVRDAAGCFASVQVNVGQGTTNLTAIATASTTTCGQNNGVATASVSGGMPVFGFQWSNGWAFPTMANLPPGTYTVTVTEGGSGCTATASATVGASASNISNMTATPVAATCNGFNGRLTVNATGTVQAVVLNWSNGFDSGIFTAPSLPANLNNLLPGNYTVTLTDGSGCSATATAVLGIVGPPIEASATATAPSTCTAADGSIEVNFTGGTAPLAYAWANGPQSGNGGGISGNSFTISGLSPGFHSITLTDAVGCQDFLWVEVSSPASFQLSATGVAPTACTLGDGAILVETTGGEAPYTYQWWRDGVPGQSGGSNAPSFSIPDLVAGHYYLTVKSGGCTAVEPLVVLPEPVMVMANFTTTPASCGNNNGTVDLTATGGSTPFNYNWTHLPGTNDPEDLTNVAPGSYTVVITEGAGCTAAATVQVEGAPLLQAFLSTTSASTCTAADGSISLFVSGGTAPFRFDWSHLPGNDDPEDLTGVAAGSYTVTVTDALNCTTVRTALVTSQVMQVFATATNGSCLGQPTGIITVDVTAAASAVPPYSYTWIRSGGGTGNASNIAAEPFQITGLVNGSYTVTVTNGEGCTRALNVFVAQGSNINISATPTAVSCFGLNDGAIELTVTGGVSPYEFNWTGTAGFASTQQNISGLLAGSYRVTVTDFAGCTRVSNLIFVDQPGPITIVPTVKPVTCVGGNDGAISVTISGGTPGQLVVWSGPNGYTGAGFSINNLMAGTYTALVVGAPGCSPTLAVEVTVSANAVPVITPKLSYINCNAVIMDVTIQSPNHVFTYLWNTGDVNSILTSPTVPGTYTVVVANVTCGTTASKTIELKPCGQIAGSVLHDLDENCLDDNEPGLTSWIVKAEGTQTYFGTSQANGQYNIQVEPGHQYTVSVVPLNSLWVPCQLDNTVLVAQPFDSVPGGDFLFKKKQECPTLSVDLGSSNLRRCFSNNSYVIQYCNEGTAPATDAYIVVTLDSYLTPVSASKPYTPIGNNSYRFNVGTVAVGQCGTILLFVKLDCNAPLGATHCSEAHIYPDTLCEPPNLQWSGASLRVRSECQVDSVQFVMKNIGTADMTKAVEYIVIEDLVMMMKASVKLDAGDSSVVKVPARGTTWRMELEQEPFHPGLSRPASVVEGCNASATFSTGMVNVFPPDDLDKFISIDCRPNTAAYDPNDKQAVPTGYGTAHYVEPNTRLEYTIRFQNTGNDTAFTVVLRDTLSAWLDPATVRPGASSHPYSWDLSGTGHLTFTFENILLPDTATNLEASQGFVQYTIWPKDSVPLESQVLNRAGIYFDFNPPIITNQTLHTLGRNFIVSSTWQPERPQYRVKVMPNPMGDEARLTVLGLPEQFGDFRLQVFDLQGNAVRDMASATPVFLLKKAELPSGVYFFRVLAEGRLVGSGKVVVE